MGLWYASNQGIVPTDDDLAETFYTFQEYICIGPQGFGSVVSYMTTNHPVFNGFLMGLQADYNNMMESSPDVDPGINFLGKTGDFICYNHENYFLNEHLDEVIYVLSQVIGNFIGHQIDYAAMMSDVLDQGDDHDDVQEIFGEMHELASGILDTVGHIRDMEGGLWDHIYHKQDHMWQEYNMAMENYHMSMEAWNQQFTYRRKRQEESTMDYELDSDRYYEVASTLTDFCWNRNNVDIANGMLAALSSNPEAQSTLFEIIQNVYNEPEEVEEYDDETTDGGTNDDGTNDDETPEPVPMLPDDGTTEDGTPEPIYGLVV